MTRTSLSPALVRVLLVLVAIVSALATHALDTRGFDIHELSASEMVDTLRWLNQFYSSNEGLQRPSGLVDNGVIDYSAIANWLFQNYLQLRAGGESPEDARTSLARAIQDTPEWRARHPEAAPQ